MSEAYPNPFNPEINFDIKMLNREYININIYNVKGYKLDNIFSGYLEQGEHSFNWNATNYSTGIYIIKSETKNNTLNQKISLIK